MRLGANSGAERREPGSQTCRKLEIINNFNKGKRLGDYSRAHRLEPGAKSRRNLKILITSIRY